MPEYSVTKNTSFLTVASVAQKAVSFFYFIIVARFVGVENTGQYFFALAFASIFAVAADSGLAAVLTRESAKEPEKANEREATAFGGKLIFGALAYILLVVAANLLGYAPSIRSFIYLAGLAMFFDNIHSFFYAVFRARKNLKYESVGVVGSQIITMVIGTVALFNGWPLIWLIIAYVIPSFLNVLYAGYFAKRVGGWRLAISFRGAALKDFLAMAWPFALAGIIGRLYSYSDSLLMSKFLSSRELGLWSVPYKIVFAFQFIPLALSASVYPVFSQLIGVDREAASRLFAKAWRYLFTIVFPLAVGLFVLAEPLLSKIYGQGFAPAAPALRLLCISLIFSYLAIISGALLNAVGWQKKQTVLVAIALVVNLCANIILIPRLGITGAAVSALASNFILWLCGFWLARRRLLLPGRLIFKYANQTFWPAILMGLFVAYLFSLGVNLFLVVPASAVVYFGFLFLTGGMSFDLIKEAKSKLI